MVEKWRNYLDPDGHGTALLTDLSKFFDCIDHQFSFVKLNLCNIDTNSLCLLASYLEKRKQRTKMKGSCSNFDESFSGSQ